jgi:hypothetical protein
MPLYVWIALLLLVAATLVGIGVVGTHALSFWRTFKAFGRAMDETLRGLEASAARLTESTATFGSGMPRLEAQLARLRADLARLAVLRTAVKEARESFGWILAVYPRK